MAKKFHYKKVSEGMKAPQESGPSNVAPAAEPSAVCPPEPPPKPMEPALRLQSKLGRDFWCCQKKISRGRSIVLREASLSDSQRDEIKIKEEGGLITVEACEVEKQ
ncbi:MAG: hypothetical protein PVJ86_12615 [Phycisphaerales bacterium]